MVALAAGIAAGDDDVARAALARIDWILRRRARKRLERLLIDAALASPIDEPAHLMRIAALGRHCPDPADRAAVAAAYAKLPVRRASRAPIATVLAALVGCAAIAGVAMVALDKLDPPKRTYERPMPPPVAGAFEHGGVPLEDPAIAALIVGDFTQYVLTVDADRRSFGRRRDERTALAAKVRAAPAMQRSPALATAWQGLIDALDRWVTVPVSSDGFQAIADDLRARARAVSDQLAALGVGYYIETSVFTSGDSAHATIYAYRIAEVVFVDGKPRPMRVLDLHRIDQLNLVHALLGMESQELGDPLVLLDQIDEHVASIVLPALAPDTDFPLAGTWLAPAEDRWEDPGKLGRATGDAVRKELALALGPDAAAAARIGALLVERGTLFASWKEPLSHRNLRMPQVDTLFVPPELVAQFHERMLGVVPTDQLDRAEAIEDELLELEAPRIASRLHVLVAQSVRHHEAQHGYDDLRDEKLRYPDALAALLGMFVDQKGEPRPAAEHANAELSAYTSQIANDPATPQLALWSMARHAFTEHRWGTVESYAAVIVIDGLARHLGIAPHDPIIHDGAIDRIRLSAIAALLPTRPPTELRRAASALWQELYGEPLAPITDRSATIQP